MDDRRRDARHEPIIVDLDALVTKDHRSRTCAQRKNRKKEGSLSSTRDGDSPETEANAATFTLSIADVIQIVNTTHQSILSDDVLKALGEERNPEGYYAKRVKFSLSQQTDEEYNLAVRSGDMEKAQEKSAEATVYTDDGGLIPLSQRFKENKRDIRYSLTPTEKAQRAQKRAETAAAKAEEAKQAAQESYKRELTGGLKKLFEVQSYDNEALGKLLVAPMAEMQQGGTSPEYWARRDYESGDRLQERLQRLYSFLNF